MEELFELICVAQEKMVIQELAALIGYDEVAALDYARFTAEEAMELVRCFPFRKPWKPKTPVDQVVTDEELADVRIH